MLNAELINNEFACPLLKMHTHKSQIFFSQPKLLAQNIYYLLYIIITLCYFL